VEDYDVGGIARTVDGGEHWELIEFPDEAFPDLVSATFNGWARGLSFYSAYSGWVLGSQTFDWYYDEDDCEWIPCLRGLVFHTADGGRSWIRYRLGPDEYPEAVAATGPRSAIIVVQGRQAEDGSFILSTVNGGLTWTRQDFPAYFLYDVVFADQRKGLVIGVDQQGGSVLLRTADGGVTWEQIPMGPGRLCLPVFLDHRLGVAYRYVRTTDGYAYVPMVSTDGGRTWAEGDDRFAIPDVASYLGNHWAWQYPLRCRFVTPALRWAIGYNHELLRWTPGGAPLSPVLVD
jgi:photosystem II stability/assembly factor-like uncharacterized protein